MKQLYYVLALFITLSSCKNQEKEKPQVVPEIPVVAVMQKDMPIYIEQVGQIYGMKDIPIRARVDGFLEKLTFEEGGKVKAGQLLYSIDQGPFMADVAAYQSKVSEAQTRLTHAKNELDRYKPLAEINAVSKSDLDAAQADYDAAKAAVEAARANLTAANINLSYCQIKSPIDGVIGKTDARVGEYIGRAPNPVILATVSSIDTVRVQFSISEAAYLNFARKFADERDANNGKNAPKAKAKAQLILADNSVFENEGVIDFVNSQVDASTGSLIIQASFENPRQILRPGLYAKVRVLLNIEKDALVIPQRCVMEIQGQYFVYVVGADGVVEQRAVKLGQKSGDLWLVTDGLKAQEQIVIDALQRVKPKMTVKPTLTTFTSKSKTE